MKNWRIHTSSILRGFLLHAQPTMYKKQIKITTIYDFQVGYVLGFIVIAAIILVGLLVYYVGVMNVSNELDNCLSITAATSTTSKPAKEKVQIMI